MERRPPSTQMREALTGKLLAGAPRQSLQQFVARATEPLLQVGWRSR